MEVHHHPHAGKKNLKAYLLEGFMIFIAVMLGFFAENLRERITDNRRLHEYIGSMVNDLQGDPAMYDSCITFNLAHCRMIDTIITSIKQKKDNTSEIYYRARQLTMGSSVLSPDAKTFDQMKSNGGLRLIHQQMIADNIASYYQWMKKFDYWSDLQRQRINDIIHVNDRIFDGSVFFSILKGMENNPGTRNPGINPALISTDAPVVNSVFMCYQYYYGMLQLMNQRALLASVQAARLIALLKKEYRME